MKSNLEERRFLVWATYAKSISAKPYVIYSTSKAKAKVLFQNTYPWLNIIEKIDDVERMEHNTGF